MKKRLAAVAAMSLAMFQGLSVAGMLPAQAAAPVVAHDDCYVTAGTLFALGSNSDIIEGLTGTLDENGSSGHADGLDVSAEVAALIDQGDMITVTDITGGTGVEIAVDDVLEVSSETGNTQLDFVETGNNIDITGTATVTASHYLQQTINVVQAKGGVYELVQAYPNMDPEEDCAP